jgi:hypothetical protein
MHECDDVTQENSRVFNQLQFTPDPKLDNWVRPATAKFALDSNNQIYKETMRLIAVEVEKMKLALNSFLYRQATIGSERRSFTCSIGGQ